VGTTSAVQAVALLNIGNASVSISSIAISGTNSGDFAQTNNCGSSLAAGANCTISVTFTPAATGSRSASLVVTDNATGSPQTVSLTGTGAHLPVVSLSPTSLTFGPENQGSTTAPQGVTLSNTGSALLSISNVAFSGNSPLDYAQTNNCGSSVSAGSNCTINVTFTPTYAYAYTSSALLAVTDNASGSPQTVSLTGKGIPMATPPGTYGAWVYAQSGNDFKTLYVTVTVQ
jgi:hypothetical protein